jgi:hypothetical protein
MKASFASRLVIMSVTAFIVYGAGTLAVADVPRATSWAVSQYAQPTSFTPDRNTMCEEPGKIESCEHYLLLPVNVGGKLSEGTVTVVDTLPAGLTAVGTPFGENEIMGWSCTTEVLAERSTATCESGGEVPALTPTAPIDIPVKVEPGLHGVVTNHVVVSGGGATSSLVDDGQALAGAEPPPFGPLAFELGTVDAGGIPAVLAGAHPAGLTQDFAMPNAYAVRTPGSSARAFPVQEIKQIIVDLPVGLIGNALAAAKCPLYNVTNLKGNLSQCPSASKVGKLALVEPGGAETELKIFNVTPERGYAAEFAVYLPTVQRALLLYAKVVGSGANTRVRIISSPQSGVAADDGISLTFFGNPAEVNGSAITPLAMFTSPSDCGAPGFTSTLYMDSWQQPARLEASGEPDLTDPNWKRISSASPRVRGCEALHFEPSLSFAPEAGHSLADEPAGYESVLKVPQTTDPAALATPPLKTTVVTLPPGVAISPAAATGLAGCGAGANGIGLEDELEASQPGHCPEASKIGEVEAATPVLEEKLKGAVYVAQPTCGGPGEATCTEAGAEDGNVFSVYLELGSEASGVHVKVKGTVEVGGNGNRNGLALGQVRTTFAETPQQPLSELRLKFDGGPRAVLANPQSCGVITSTGVLESWAHRPAPGEKEGTPNVTTHFPFSISGCEEKFAPAFSAGSVNARAGAFSPLSVTFSRQDREQDLAGVTTRMPPGLVGKVAGIPECGDADAAAGTCPGATRVGSVSASAGSGPAPLWQTGSAYFTGPYKGSAFGLSLVVPAKAGPYNLGDIVVRASLAIDPQTAAVTVVSDPLPRSIDGVPLRVKTVNVTIDRDAFTLNPTNCGEQAIGATIVSTQGTSSPVSSRFQATNCAGLKFTPKLSVATGHNYSKANGASLTFKIAYPAGALGSQSWLKLAKFDIPKQLPARLTTLHEACLASVFDANPAACPAPSRIGIATVHTPVLPVPLAGPVYFVSHGGAKFPDAVMVLQGDGVTVNVTGETFINGKTGVTSATFRAVPDVPFEDVEVKIPTGKFSEFTGNLPASAHGSFCGQNLVMPTEFVGQNGAEIKRNTQVAVEGCSTRLAIAAHSVKRRTLKLVVYAPSAGRLKISGRGLRSVVKNVAGQENVSVQVHVARKGRFKSKVRVSFTPSKGAKSQGVVKTLGL